MKTLNGTTEASVVKTLREKGFVASSKLADDMSAKFVGFSVLVLPSRKGIVVRGCNGYTHASFAISALRGMGFAITDEGMVL